MLADLLVVAHAVAVLFLAGFAWTVTVVVYPGFVEAGRTAAWPDFHAAHSRRITYLVAPPWAVQGITLVGLLVTRPDGVPLGLVLLAGVAAAVTVLETFLGAVPVHQRLGSGFDRRLHRRLVRADAWRTGAWTVSAVLGVVLLVTADL